MCVEGPNCKVLYGLGMVDRRAAIYEASEPSSLPARRSQFVGEALGFADLGGRHALGGNVAILTRYPSRAGDTPQ